MPAFAAWIGRMAAAFAALLAVIWFFEAMPYSGAEAARLALDCKSRALNSLPPGLALAEARACDTRFSQWNDTLTTYALLAAGAAVVLLLLTAMVPKPAPAYAPPPPRPAPLSFTELSRRIAFEIADHKRLTGRDLPEAEARRRVEWRHEQGLHREPPP